MVADRCSSRIVARSGLGPVLCRRRSPTAEPPRFGSMKPLRPEEEWARDIISQTLSVPVEQHDDNSRDGMHDLWIVYPDRPPAAVEVTAAADPEAIE
jgi:hypothetical protein